MKLPCEIVQDLLPLYEEDLCSPVSRAAVEEHLQECEKCRGLIEDIQKLKEPEMPVEARAEEQAVTRSFRKIHRKWRASLLAMLLVVPVLLMTVNQIRRQGICFTNLDEIFVAWRYIQALEQGNFEEAADFMDYENFHEEIKKVLCQEPNGVYGNYHTELLGEDEWMVSAGFYDEYLKWETEADDFWGNVIFNRVQQVMVPEEIWRRITSQEPESIVEIEEGVLLFNEEPYILLETKWGNYIVEKNSGIKDCVTAEDFCAVLEVIPKEIWDEAYSNLEKQAWEEYYERQAKFDEADDMTLEEFTEFIRNKYLTCAENFAGQGIKIQGTGYEGSYYSEGDGHWCIEYGIMWITEEGEYPVTVDLRVKDGKVLHIGSLSHKDDMNPDEVEKVFELFNLRYLE